MMTLKTFKVYTIKVLNLPSFISPTNDWIHGD